MSEWRIVPISELCEFIVDCLHETPEIVEYKTGYLMVRTSDVGNGYISLDSARNVTKEVYLRRVQRAVPQKGDIIISREAPLGEVGRVNLDNTICLGQRLIHYRPDPKQVNPRYLLYALLSPSVQTEFHANKGVGSVVDNLRMNVARSLPIPLVPLKYQDFIADLLGSLDDKIEANRRMNATLEATARALFQSWFVDFDPVYAQERGEQPSGMDAETAALFPDRFQDSELGPIPAGWRVGSILKQSKLLSGGTPKTDCSEYWDGDILWASAKDVSQCGETFLISTERTITGRGLQESATQLIPPLSTVIVARGATTGRMVLLGQEMAMNQTCYALVSTTNTPFSLYCHLRNEIGALVYAGHGSVFNTITTSTFANSVVVIPPSPAFEAFENAVSPIFSQVLNNSKESSTLSDLRDALLPKLVSGELRVGD